MLVAGVVEVQVVMSWTKHRCEDPYLRRTNPDQISYCAENMVLLVAPLQVGVMKMRLPSFLFLSER